MIRENDIIEKYLDDILKEFSLKSESSLYRLII